MAVRAGQGDIPILISRREGSLLNFWGFMKRPEKLIVDPKRSIKAQEMQKTWKVKFRSLALPDFNIYYKAKIIKTECSWHQDTYKGQ